MDNQNKPTSYNFSRNNSDGYIAPADLSSSVEAGALSFDSEQSSVADAVVQGPPTLLAKVLRRADLVLLALLILGALSLVISSMLRKEPDVTANQAAGSEYNSLKLPLEEFVTNSNGQLNLGSVEINGQLQLNRGVVIAPSVQPNAPTAGQLYFDQNTNQLAYYSGSQFVPLGATGESVEGIGGLSGQVALGGGLNAAGGKLNNTGVLSLQGQTGAITLSAGNGVGVTGTTISNTGVVSLVSASPALSVTNDGNGNFTLTGSGAGTVSSPGGTTGALPLFTGAQSIGDSLLTQSGGTVTVGGGFAVTGALSLGTALSVANGGTGASALNANGVLVGGGVSPVTSVAAGGAGLCLMSTVAAPTWGACPGGGGGGVTSVNGLSGVLTVANATGVGSTITIDDATTGAKGIASFDSTNFSVVGGAVNTIQNINTTATPTFTGVNTNSVTPSAALTVGVSGQTALLQGSTTTITSNGAGNDIILNSADTIELQDNTNVTGNVVASGDVAVNGGDLTSAAGLNITPGGTLTAGVSAQTLTLQGNASTTLRSTNAGSTTIVGFTSPTANTTLNFPALSAGTYTICTTSGNCAGVGVTLQAAYTNSTNPEIVLDATRAALTIRDNASAIGGNLLEVQSNSGATTYLAVTSSGAAVTGTISATGNINSSGGVIQTNGTTRIDNSGNLTNIVALTASGSGTFQGGSVTLGTNAQAGSLIISDGSSNTGTIQTAALAQNTVYTLPDPGGGTATICLTTGNCTGVGGGVTGSGTNNRLSKFTATGSTIGDSTISDDGANVTTSVDLIIQGGQATIGVANSQTGSVSFAHSGSAFTGTITQAALSASRTYNLPNSDGDICLSSGNCLGGGGGGATTALSNLTGVAINTTLLPGVAGGVNLGSGTLPFGDLFVAGTSGTPGTNNFRITGASTGGTQVITLPNATGTVCLQSSASCGFAPATGSANYIQNQAAGDQLAATFRIDGDGRAAIFNGTTGLNTGSGSGTQRVDAAGNLVNIGNITATGATTLSSTGGGNDIILNSADTIELQDNTNVTGNVVASGDIAANGGDITSSGALNITPGGALTVGATAQTFTLQGNAGSTITATGGGFTTEVGFTGSPTGAVTYNYDRAAVPGTYSICTTAGNCAGVGTTVQQAYNNSTNPELVVDGTRGALTVRDNASPLGTNLLEIQSNNGATTYLGVTATGLTTSGDLALNGGDLTSSGGLNITPTGALVLGSTTQNAVLQGNASSTITATSGASSTTLSFQTPTANVNYRFATATAGNYDICTSSGNCPGVTDTLQSSYTASTNPEIVVDATRGALTVRDNASAIGTNLLEVQSNNGAATYFGVSATGTSTTGTSTTSGNINSSGGTLQTAGANRVDNSGNLVNIGNLTATAGITIASTGATNDIVLNSADTIELQDNTNVTGNFTTTGDVAVNGGDITSSGALNITPTGTLVLGSTTQIFTLQGSATSTITATGGGATTTVGFAGTPTGAVTFNFDRAATAGTYTICTTAQNCTLQMAYNASTNPEITLDNTRGGLTIRDNGTPVTGNLLEVQNSGGATNYLGLTTTALTLGSNVDLLMQGASAYISNPQAQTASEAFGLNASVTAQNAVAVGNGATVPGDDSIAIGSGATAGGGGNGAIAIGRSASAAGTNRIAIGNGASAGSNSVVIGNVSSGSSSVVSIGASSNVTGAAGTSVGFTATSSNNGLALGASASASGAQNAIAIGASATVAQQFSIALGISATTSAQHQFVVGGSSAAASYISSVYFGSGVTDATPQAVTIQGTGGNGTDIVGASVNIGGGRGTGAGNGGSINFQIADPGSSGVGLNALATAASISGTDGSATFQNTTNSAAAFRVLTAGTLPLFTVDTSSSLVYVGNPTDDAADALLVLDGVSGAADPGTGVNGAMYYNTTLNGFRCYEQGTWEFCRDQRSLLYGYTTREDFMNNGDGTAADTVGDLGWQVYESLSTGYVIQRTSDAARRPGQKTLHAEDSAVPDRAALVLGGLDTTSGESVVLGGDQITIDTAINIPTLPTAGENFTFRFGLCDLVTANCDDGVYFAADRSISTTNWVIATATNGTGRTQNAATGANAALSTGWHNFRMVINTNGSSPTSVNYFIDGVAAGTVSTNIPSGANATSPGFQLIKSAGTSARDVYIDFFEMKSTYTTR